MGCILNDVPTWGDIRRRLSLRATGLVAIGFVVTAVAAAGVMAATPVGPPESAGAAGGRTETPRRSAVTTAAEVQSPCPTRPPESRTDAWFNHADGKAPTPITRGLARTICAAAEGATIRIAMYYAYPGTNEVDRIISALRYVQRVRDVRVMVVVDAAGYASEARQAKLRSLRRFAHVESCMRGCRSVGNFGVAHNKFLVVSDTVWRPWSDPVVVQSTANWSKEQLQRYQQSALMIWDDPWLAYEMTIRWSNLRVCATAGCNAWNTQLSRRGLDPHVYRAKRHGDVWGDPGLWERSGTAGRGLHVWFSPRFATTGRGDPMARQLGRFRCQAGSETVRVAAMHVSRPAVIDALDTLQRRGCTVRVLVSSEQQRPFMRGVAAMRSKGLSVRCVPRLHDKYIFVNAVDPATNRARRVLWTGSQNLGPAGLTLSDNTMVRLTPNTADKVARTENERVLAEYATNHRRLSSRTVACPRP